jgi:PKD repeat protein/C-terminal processing protease CtpA/Prc
MKSISTFRWIPAILLLSLSMQVFAQTVPADYQNRLFYLCKAWGHAKYYHTQIAKGLVNWDDKLLAAIPGVKSAANDTEFSTVVLAMLNSAGTMGTSTVTLPVVPNDLNLNPDRTWIDNTIFSSAVQLNLKNIQQKFRPQTNVYVGKQAAGNPDFTTDVQYGTESDYPSEEKRLLALFRYWNMVHYFSPYKSLMDQPWDETLREFIPKITESPNAESYSLTFKEMSTHLHQADFFTSPAFNAWNGESFPPFNARFIGGETVITQVLAGTSGITAGDVIKAIDGLDIYTLRTNLRKYATGGTAACVERSLNEFILYGPAGSFSITVDRGAGPIEVTLERNATNFNALLLNPDKAWRIENTEAGDPFGIVEIARLEVAAVPTMFAELWNTKAMIIDMRGKHLGTMWNVASYLLSEPVHLANLTAPNVTYPGTLYRGNSTGGTPTGNPYNGKVILLVDERTVGSNEFMCMIIGQLPDLTIIGSQTQGSDGNYSIQTLPGNISTMMVGIGIFYPDGTQTQRIGIVPDFVVNQTISDTRAGKDAPLAFALNSDLLTVHPGYCMSAGDATGEWISSVTLGTNTKSSGSSLTNGYENFTSAPFSVEAGKSYTISLKPGFSRSTYENWAVWIDYNGDQGFDEPGELVFSKSRSKTTVTGTVVIPAGLNVTTRMRVSMSSLVVPGACETYTAGEVEDYTLIISSPAPPPLVAGFIASPLTVEVGKTVQFTDQSTGTPTGWSWSFPGGNTASLTIQNPSVTYAVAGTYDVTLAVSRPGASSTVTKTGYIKVNEIVIQPYCVPSNISSSADYIKTVAITGVVTNTTGGTGYTGYQVSTPLTPGKSYTVTLTPNNTSYRNYWKIWIDFNKDGDFTDTGENVLTGSNKRGYFGGSITIPAGAAGNTRMRISMRSGATPLPCDNNFTGEVEDYDIMLGSAGPVGDDVGHQTDLILDLSSNLKIYPNPVSHELTVSVDELSDQNDCSIYTMEGKLLHKCLLTANLTTIDVRNLVSGIYLVRLNCGGKIVNQKFVKE